MHAEDERPAPAGFRHVALLYQDDEDYLGATVPFVEAGLAAGEPVLVAVPGDRLGLLRSSLPEPAHPLLRFAPMEVMGRNPAWMIPAWAAFVGPHVEAGRPARGIGEPAWFGRSEVELVECNRHEALLNVAFSDTAGFELLCPYDTRRLPGSVLDEAFHHHPVVGDAHGRVHNDRFEPGVSSWMTAPLPAPPSSAEVLAFHGGVVSALRRRVAEAATDAGLPPSRVDDLLVAVGEAAANAVRHGGGTGELAHWRDASGFVCEVRDRGRISDPLAGRRRPDPRQEGGRGLWLIHQLCDLVQIRVRPEGQVVRLRLHLTA